MPLSIVAHPAVILDRTGSTDIFWVLCNRIPKYNRLTTHLFFTMYSDDEWVEFSPPDKGLNPGEEVVWSRRSGMTAWVMLSGGCCIVFSPWVLLFIYTFSGPLLGNVVLAIVGIGILLTIVELINSRRTKYYLTTTRIIEVRGGLIHTQIPLESLQGVGINDYLKLKSTYREGGDYFYEARIRDPSSGKVLRLTGLDEDGKEIISKLGN